MTIATVITATFVFTFTENIYPWIYVKNVFGLLFVFFLPGFSFVKAIFPNNLSDDASKTRLEGIEQIAISMGMSITLVSMFGLLLYYSPLGLDITTIVLFLVPFTSIFTTAAVIKEHIAKKLDFIE